MEKIVEVNYLSSSNICRICLQKVENGIALFSGGDISTDILDKMFSCFQFILTQENFLPSIICNNCSEELESANKFRLKCVTFEERYNTLFKMCDEVEDHGNSDSENIKEIEDVFEPKERIELNSLQINTANQNNEFKCETCSKTLKSAASLSKHIVSMHQRRRHVGRLSGSGHNRRYHCTKCPYSTPHSQTLVNHMRRHNGERPYHCKCGKSFTQSSSLTAHQKTHSDTMMFTCSSCGKQFKHAFSLKNHLSVHDTGKFSCNICAKTLKSQRALQGHINRHYNIRNYNCEDCGATFVTSSELLNHKMKHSKEMNVECHLCGYKTYAKKNLMIHIKRHTGEKAFRCDLCGKTAYTQSDLRRHQRVHSQEKPYPCPVCAQRFSHSGTLNQHARNVHGITYRWGESKAMQNRISNLKLEPK